MNQYCSLEIQIEYANVPITINKLLRGDHSYSAMKIEMKITSIFRPINNIYRKFTKLLKYLIKFVAITRDK